MDDLKESLNHLWDNIPIDTVIASILDPRTKYFERIPNNEINEALKVMQKVSDLVHLNFLICKR
jgi:hypothetical protein